MTTEFFQDVLWALVPTALLVLSLRAWLVLDRIENDHAKFLVDLELKEFERISREFTKSLQIQDNMTDVERYR